MLHPPPTQVLLYMLTQPALVVQAWRKRQYFYASATIFREICGPLKKWLYSDRDPDSVAKDDAQLVRRTIRLRKLRDEDGLYGHVGDTIISFVKAKRAPFPGAMLSQQHFLQYATWKMAFIFVKLVRELTCSHANKHWNKFGYENFKLNKQCFGVFCQRAPSIWQASPMFRAMPPTYTPPKKGSDEDEDETTPKKTKQRTRKRFELSSPEGDRKAKKSKMSCAFSDSDDDDAGAGAGKAS